MFTSLVKQFISVAVVLCMNLVFMCQHAEAERPTTQQRRAKVQEKKEQKAADKFDITKEALPRERPFKVGDKGYLFEAQVSQVLSPTSALVNVFYVKANVNFEYIHYPELCMVQCGTKNMHRGTEWNSFEQYEVKPKVETPDGKMVWLLEPLGTVAKIPTMLRDKAKQQ